MCPRASIAFGVLTRPLALMAALAVSIPLGARAQIPIPAVPTPSNPADTVRADPFRVEPPVPPLGALWRSMLFPGWGQSMLNRRVTGAFFVLWEGISITMTIKSVHQLEHLKSVLSEDDPESLERVDSKRREVQDWAVLLGFNHLMAGAEAFVAAYLWDFPEELEIRAFHGGRGEVGILLSVPIP